MDTVLECPFCGHKQDKNTCADPTSAICEECGKTYLISWKLEKAKFVPVKDNGLFY
jgi:hypothetical protein